MLKPHTRHASILNFQCQPVGWPVACATIMIKIDDAACAATTLDPITKNTAITASNSLISTHNQPKQNIHMDKNQYHNKLHTKHFLKEKKSKPRKNNISCIPGQYCTKKYSLLSISTNTRYI